MSKTIRHFTNPWVGVVGGLIVILALYVLIAPVGEEHSTVGVSGALNLPLWVVGLVLLVLALTLLYWAIRQLLRER